MDQYEGIQLKAGLELNDLLPYPGRDIHFFSDGGADQVQNVDGSGPSRARLTKLTAGQTRMELEPSR